MTEGGGFGLRTIRSSASWLYSARGLTFSVGLLVIVVPAVTVFLQSFPDLSRPPTSALLDLVVGGTTGIVLIGISLFKFTYRSAVYGFAAGVAFLSIGLAGRNLSGLFPSLGATGFILLVSTPIPMLGAPGEDTIFTRSTLLFALLLGPYMIAAPIVSTEASLSVFTGSLVIAGILALFWAGASHRISREVLLGVWSHDGSDLVSFSESVPESPQVGSRETVRLAGVPFLVALNLFMLLFQLGGETNPIESSRSLALGYMLVGLAATGIVIPAFWWFDSLEIMRINPETQRTERPIFPLLDEFLGVTAIFQLFVLGLGDHSIWEAGSLSLSAMRTLAIILLMFPPFFLATLYYVWRGWEGHMKSLEELGEYTRISSVDEYQE